VRWRTVLKPPSLRQVKAARQAGGHRNALATKGAHSKRQALHPQDHRRLYRDQGIA